MHQFILTSPNDAIDPAQFMGADCSQLLGWVHRLGWRTADVDQDGAYLCSVHVDDNEVWSISQRAPCQRYAEAPAHWYSR
jgi:hypothetical protein